MEVRVQLLAFQNNKIYDFYGDGSFTFGSETVVSALRTIGGTYVGCRFLYASSVKLLEH